MRQHHKAFLSFLSLHGPISRVSGSDDLHAMLLVNKVPAKSA